MTLQNYTFYMHAQSSRKLQKDPLSPYIIYFVTIGTVKTLTYMHSIKDIARQLINEAQISITVEQSHKCAHKS